MDGGSASGSKSKIGKPKESKACLDLYRDLTDLTSQVQMISDSLVACRQMSKHRNSRRTSDAKLNQTYPISLLPEEKSQSKSKDKSVIVSYMSNDLKKLNYLQNGSSWGSRENILIKTYSDFSENLNGGTFSQGVESLTMHESSNMEKRRSEIGMYEAKDVDSRKMIQIIQRELKTLMNLVPQVTLIIIALSDTLFHYKECLSCNEKISPSLPWVLNRVQTLIKYLSKKKQGFYHWPNDHDYLRREESAVEEGTPLEPLTELGTTQKVQAVDVAEGKLGIQLLLQVEPESKSRKKYLERANRRNVRRIRGKFPIVEIQQPSSASVIQVLKPEPSYRVIWDNKLEIITPRERIYGISGIFAYPIQLPVGLSVFSPKERLTKLQKSKPSVFCKPIAPLEQRVVQLRKNPVTVFVSQRPKPKKPVSFKPRGNQVGNILANASDLVQDLLEEAKEEKMQIQKVKELESEVRGLKELMLEVHKNQVELSKILMEKRVCSQPIIKLIDPNMLEEENNVVEIAEKPGKRSSSVESLQTTVNHLKRKCSLKNRMIMTLLNGLRSNVPKEWWEEVANSTFDESKPIEEFDPEKISQFIRETSFVLSNSEKEARRSQSKSRLEDPTTEESDADTVGATDSEKESDYATGVEEYSDDTMRTSTERSGSTVVRLSSPRLASAYVQKLLYEDSIAGVAVVDLFVAVKTVKDNLDYLSKCSGELFAKLAAVDEEGKLLKLNLEKFFRSVKLFMKRIEADANFWDFLRQKNKPELQKKEPAEEKKPNSGTTEKNLENRCSECIRKETENSQSCSECGKHLMEAPAPFNQISISPEAFLGSFMASLLWLKTNQDSESNTSVESTKTPKMKESTVEIICNICEVLNKTCQEEVEADSDEDSNWSSGVSCGSNNSKCCLFCRINPSPNCVNCARAQEHSDKTISDVESDFEEALTSVSENKPELKLSVTCLSDLAKSSENKTALTSTDISSWVDKISNEIKSRIMKLKSKTNVQVHNQPYKKEEKDWKNSHGATEFTINAQTPVGVFDVTGVQYKRRRSGETPVENFKLEAERSDKATTLKEDYLLEESLNEVESSESESASDDDEDDLEEFLEIFVDGAKENDETVTDFSVKGFEYKTQKPNYFEIHKCYPVYFLHEILQKNENPNELINSEPEQDEIITINTGEKKEKQFVIERDSSDILIFIQVEVEDGPKPAEIYVEFEKNSLGTQTKEDTVLLPIKEPANSLIVWEEESEKKSLTEADEKDRITFADPTAGEETEVEIKEDDLEQISIDEEEKIVNVKEPKRKSVTFNEEIFVEKEIQQAYLEEDKKIREEPDEGVVEANETKDPEELKAPEETEQAKTMSSSQVVDYKTVKETMGVWFFQKTPLHRVEIIPREPMISQEIIETISLNAIELDKALSLLREIENNIVEVKLGDAISVLPVLESELRKHLKSKLKNLGDSEAGTSIDNFFSALDFWPEEENTKESHESLENPEERLHRLLKLLSDLEEAVRSNDFFNGVDVAHVNSSKIYKLLHALTMSIRELEESPNVASFSRTLEIASELDTVVREYDSIVRKQPWEYVTSGKEEEEEKGKKGSETLRDVPAIENLSNVRKKVFEIVETEAVGIEERIEKDFDRLDILEKQNDEAMMFLEAFLVKTEKRVSELTNLKTDLKNLSSSLNGIYAKLQEKSAKLKEKQKQEAQAANEEKEKEKSPEEESPVPKVSETLKEEPVRETISGLLSALDRLKTKAREKKEVCKEILSSVGSEKFQDSKNSSRRSSKSSFTSKNSEMLTSTVKEFKRIGHNSLYLSWAKPEGQLKQSILGYQIHVNGKLNQKVRNPQRLQAVLYSVELENNNQVQLFAIVEDNPKILIATEEYNLQ